jgi:hypothetical protein
MAAMPQPQPQPESERRALPDVLAATGVTLGVDFAAGRILGPIDPQGLPRTEPAPDDEDLPRRRAE